MREDLKNKRTLSYLTNIWDDVNLPYIVNYNNIKEQVINFFNTESELIYPAKTIFVAIVYAKCLEKYFNIPFYESLSDIELLPDDMFFKDYNYNNNKELYDDIIDNLKDIWYYESINKTVNYFKKEFLICN